MLKYVFLNMCNVPNGEATIPVSGQLVRTSFLGFDSE